MTNQEQMEMLRERLLPLLFDCGVEGFVLTGYAKMEDDKIERICIAHTGKNPAYEDGLRQVIAFAHMWGGTPLQGPSPAQPQ